MRKTVTRSIFDTSFMREERFTILAAGFIMIFCVLIASGCSKIGFVEYLSFSLLFTHANGLSAVRPLIANFTDNWNGLAQNIKIGALFVFCLFAFYSWNLRCLFCAVITARTVLQYPKTSIEPYRRSFSSDHRDNKAHDAHKTINKAHDTNLQSSNDEHINRSTPSAKSKISDRPRGGDQRAISHLSNKSPKLVVASVSNDNNTGNLSSSPYKSQQVKKSQTKSPSSLSPPTVEAGRRFPALSTAIDRARNTGVFNSSKHRVDVDERDDAHVNEQLAQPEDSLMPIVKSVDLMSNVKNIEAFSDQLTPNRKKQIKKSKTPPTTDLPISDKIEAFDNEQQKRKLTRQSIDSTVIYDPNVVNITSECLLENSYKRIRSAPLDLRKKRSLIKTPSEMREREKDSIYRSNSEEEIFELHMSARKRACTYADRVIEKNRNQIVKLEKGIKNEPSGSQFHKTETSSGGLLGFPSSTSFAPAVVATQDLSVITSETMKKLDSTPGFTFGSIPATEEKEKDNEKSSAFLKESLKLPVMPVVAIADSPSTQQSEILLDPDTMLPLDKNSKTSAPTTLQRERSVSPSAFPASVLKPPPSPSTRKTSSTPPIGIAFAETGRREVIQPTLNIGGSFNFTSDTSAKPLVPPAAISTGSTFTFGTSASSIPPPPTSFTFGASLTTSGEAPTALTSAPFFGSSSAPQSFAAPPAAAPTVPLAPLPSFQFGQPVAQSGIASTNPFALNPFAQAPSAIPSGAGPFVAPSSMNPFGASMGAGTNFGGVGPSLDPFATQQMVKVRSKQKKKK